MQHILLTNSGVSERVMVGSCQLPLDSVVLENLSSLDESWLPSNSKMMISLNVDKFYLIVVF